MGEAKRRRQLDPNYGEKAKQLCRTASVFDWGREQYEESGRGVVAYPGYPDPPEYWMKKKFPDVRAAAESQKDILTLKSLALMEELTDKYDPESEIVIWLPVTSAEDMSQACPSAKAGRKCSEEDLKQCPATWHTRPYERDGNLSIAREGDEKYDDLQIVFR